MQTCATITIDGDEVAGARPRQQLVARSLAALRRDVHMVKQTALVRVLTRAARALINTILRPLVAERPVQRAHK